MLCEVGDLERRLIDFRVEAYCGRGMSSRKRKRIGVIGSGALGLYFGIRLAVAGHAVSFLVRSDRDLLEREGLTLTLADGREARVERPRVVGDVREMGDLEWVLVALKTTHNGALSDLLPPLVGPETRVLTLQNGIGNVESIRAVCGARFVLAGLCQIGVNREKPGRVRSFVPDDGFIQIGQDFATEADDCRGEFAAVFESAGIRTRLTESLGEALWRKLMWNVPFNGLTVEAGGTGTDVICKDPHLRERAQRLMVEIREAAEVLGFPIEADYVERLLEFTDRIGAYRASSVLDWLAGRPLEVEAIFSKPLEAGLAAGVEMPELARLTKALRALDHAV